MAEKRKLDTEFTEFVKEWLGNLWDEELETAKSDKQSDLFE